MKKIGIVAAIAVLVVAAVAACEPYGTTTVASLSLTGQTSSVSATTMYTPSSDGDFLVTIYGSCGGSGTSYETAVDYTDEFRSYNPGVSETASSGSSSFAVQVIHAVSGQPIQYLTVYESGSASCDTFVKVVKL